MPLDPFYVPLQFHREIIKDFALESGLLVLARGLGIDSLLKTLIHIYADPKVLVFVLYKETDDYSLLSGLDEEKNQVAAVETAEFISRIKTETSVKERCKIYGKGGVIMLSVRVFLMDLLHSRIPIPLITGVLLPDAHRVSEYGMEAFCLYLIRKQNEIAFIKAFSDYPEFLIRGFSKAEKILKTLRVSKLFLYPRFHMKIMEELSGSRIEVVEIASSLTQRMKMIQMSILGILETSINDICKDNSLNMQDFNTNLSILGEFDSIIQSHLESDWHKVGYKTKQLLKEIRTLRNILNYSLDYDCITFYGYLRMQVEEAQGLTFNSSSYWLLMDAANVLVEVAKERAIGREVNPKWKALQNIVKECEASRNARVQDRRPIVIIVESSHSISQLSAILSIGPSEYLEKISRTLNLDSAEKQTQVQGSKRPKPDEAADKVQDLDKDNGNEGLETEVYFEGVLGRNIIFRRTDSIDDETLKMLNPHSIIMHSPNLEILRKIELYKLDGSDSETEKLKVFFFLYSDSVEEQRYLTQVRREKEAFEQLIRTNEVMAPYNEEAGVKVEFIIEDILSKGSGGNNNIVNEPDFPRKIIVDTRDLRSSLPYLLHLYGFEIDPITITVGDYILSPTICVERKSLSDLISSLNSGRLHSQVSAMSKAYATIILLIEFDPEKPFYLLQSRSASSLRRADLSPTDLISKLVLLLLHHTKLKILWTNGPKLTCDIFYDLKRNEPNPISDNTNGSSSGSNENEIQNSSPYKSKLKEFLVKLPGINEQNFFLVMKHFPNMKALSQASQTELTTLVGSENGTRLFNFMNMNLK